MATIFTIGYGQDPFDAFEQRLKANGVDVLLDVRSAPYSRYRTDYRYGVIESLCLRAGLEYRFFGDHLGGKPTRADLLTDGLPDYHKIAASPGFGAALADVQALANDRMVALMCGCEKALQCHRGILISPQLIARGHVVLHIDRHGTAISHDDAVREDSGGQMSLFDL